MSSLAEREASLPVTVYAHVETATALSHRLGTEPGRVTLRIEGTNSVDLTLFTDRAGLVRLYDSLSAALAELDIHSAASPLPGTAA